MLLLAILVIVDYVLQSRAFPAAFAVVFGMAFLFILVQWLVSPAIVRWAIRGRQPITADSNPWLFHTVEELARQAGGPLPQIWLSEDSSPNAFVFGRAIASAALMLTAGLRARLTEVE